MKYKISLSLSLIFIFFIYNLGYSYTQSWVDGTPIFYEDAKSILRSVGNDLNFNLAPSANMEPAFHIGDIKQFYALNMVNYTQQILDASCFVVTDKAYIFVDKKILIEQTKLNSLAESFEKIYDAITKQFGPPPARISNDPRIYILILDIIDGVRPNGAMLLGYFSPIDQFRNAEIPRWIRQKSNEANMLYIDSASLNAQNINAESVISHEFTHLIQWARDPEESIWVNEGLAVFVENMLGYNVKDRISAYESNPIVSLRNWDDKVENYGMAYLFFAYIYERFGGLPIITDIFKSELEDIAGIEKVLSDRGIKETFRDIFSDWVIANYLDNTNIADGRYGYSTLDINLKPSTVETQYPIVQKLLSELPWSVRYIEFNRPADNILTLTVSESDNLIDINADLIAFESNNQIEVSSIKPVTLQSGSAFVSQNNNQVVLVISSQPDPPDQNKNSAFSYSAEAKAVPKTISVSTSDKAITTWGKIKKNLND
ncbi:MAG: hypothetical protein ACPL7B_01540 [Candidatus Poribacteria bacterium]